MAEVQLKPLPPAEAIAYFRQKGYRVGFDYRDVWQQEHQAAFTVAKAMQVDLLAEIRAGLDAALADGTTFETFQQALRPRLVARGWWGRQEMVDPDDGEKKLVQLGSPRRLQVIYDTNLATAYSEGQWERVQRNKQIFPFLEYVKSAAEHPRTEHLAYAGLVLPADDPWWQTHMPIKDYGCKCSVIQHTRRMLDREGLTVGTPPPDVMRTVVNKRTGEEMQVPAGVNPAFHYPPGGRAASLGKTMMQKAELLNSQLAARALTPGTTRWLPLVQAEFSQYVGRYEAGERKQLGSRRVVGVLSPAVLQSLDAMGRKPESAGISVQLAALSKLIGRARTAERQARNPNAAAVAALPTMLAQAESVWWDEADSGALVFLVNSPNDARLLKIAVRTDFQDRSVKTNAVRSMMYVDRKRLQTKGWTRLDGGGKR
ncbi:phage minor head protein [Variovorax sp. VNK109]|uniref:phage head morphogenesis protein n=1 Tax=Variovorax sp. VNK109 TaxID=3400919 RepID=UPI003C04BC19